MLDIYGGFINKRVVVRCYDEAVVIGDCLSMDGYLNVVLKDVEFRSGKTNNNSTNNNSTNNNNTDNNSTHISIDNSINVSNPASIAAADCEVFYLSTCLVRGASLRHIEIL